MANEVTISAGLSGSKNSVTVAASISRNENLAGNNMYNAVQVIGTSAEQLAIPADMSDVAWWFIRNLDPTNYVELALDSGVSTQKFSKVAAGQFMLLPPNAGNMAIHAKANTSPVSVQVVAIGT